MAKNYLVISLAALSFVLLASRNNLEDENAKLKSYIESKNQTEATETAVIEANAVNKEKAYKEANIDAKTIHDAKKISEEDDLRTSVDNARRLLNASEARANLYKQAAATGANAAATCANRLVEMDQSLSRGRVLATDLHAALRERDRELGLAIAEVKALRKALDQKP